MSDLEYDVLDELYFVQSYTQLRDTLQWDDQMLKSTYRISAPKRLDKVLFLANRGIAGG